MSKLQVTVAGVLLIAGMATPLVLQHQSLSRVTEENNRLREETQTLRQQASQVAQLAEENQRLSNQLAHAASAPALTQAQRAELLRLRGEATRLRASEQANAQTTGPTMDFLRSTEGKEMMRASMRSQAQAVVKAYGKLFADLHLAPEQTATLKDLMVKQYMTAADMASAAMAGQADPAQLKAQSAQVSAERAAIDDQIKQLLGDDNYAQYHTYGKTLDQRLILSQLTDELAGSPGAVTPEQEQQLFDALVQERQGFKFTTDYSDTSKIKANPSAYYSEAGQQLYLQELDQLSQRYLARAQTILSASQLTTFQSALASQQARQAAGVSVGAKLFRPKTAGN